MSKREYIREYIKNTRQLNRKDRIIVNLAILTAIEGVVIICLAASLTLGMTV